LLESCCPLVAKSKSKVAKVKFESVNLAAGLLFNYQIRSMLLIGLELFEGREKVSAMGGMKTILESLVELINRSEVFVRVILGYRGRCGRAQVADTIFKVLFVIFKLLKT
jgi:hypothetical protein